MARLSNKSLLYLAVCTALNILFLSYKSGHYGEREPKRILFWTKVFQSKDFYGGLGATPFQGCPVSACETTTNRQLLPLSDAVMFHPIDMRWNDLPKSRRPEQPWIFFLLEPPSVLSRLAKGKNIAAHSFNWTMTYRTDSDIVRTYNRLGDWLSENEDHWNAVRMNKTKKVAWFVSNCRTESKREQYVKELRKHIDVDIYGRCGKLKCAKRGHGQDCLRKLSSHYKFYLALENSVCRDYVTEKFFNALKSSVVPIVNGGADYAQFAPEGSYIHTRDFESAKHLADYLNYLDANQTAYEQYFQWKSKYVPRSFNPWCRLCQMLHTSPLPRKSYADVYNWWRAGSECNSNGPLKTSHPDSAFLWDEIGR